MLNKKEIAVMDCIYSLAHNNNDCCIVSDERILESCPENLKLRENDVNTIVKQLEYDGYFECTKSDRNGKRVNVITLKNKGKAFKRELVQRKREIISNSLLRVAYAAIGAIVTLLIRSLFS